MQLIPMMLFSVQSVLVIAFLRRGDILTHLSCVSRVIDSISLCNRMLHIYHSLIVDYIREGLRSLDRIYKSKKAPVNCRRC